MHWIQKHKEKGDPQSVVLAVQTLRNTILVAVFIGGIALNTAYNVLTNLEVDNPPFRLQVRAVILSVLLFFSFLNWACVIRQASHLGYMIGTLEYLDKPAQKKPPSESSPGVKHVENSMEIGDESSGISIEQVKDPKVLRKRELNQKYMVNRAQSMIKLMLIYFSLGFRFLFMAIPFAFFGIGPVPLLIATFIMLLFSYHHDFYQAKVYGE